jgi:diguanylate cyclase (GGDEF)-like protein/PAS domain S-box-containing protein
LIIALNIFIGTTVAQAKEAVVLPVGNDAVNLSEFGLRYESQDPNLQIKVPGADGTGSEELVVSALSERAPYRWLKFSLANSTNSVVKPLIVVPQRGFAGTGLMWPLIGGRTVLSIVASSGAEPEAVFGRPGIYRLSVGPKQTVTYVVEISGNWPPRLGLWNERAYQFHLESRALFRGLLLGIAGLIALYLTVLFFVSRQATYLSGALLSIASTVLLLSEFGYFSHSFLGSPDMAIKIRSATEALMSLGVFSFFHTFLLLRYRLPFLGYMNLLLLFALAGLVGYAFYQPYYAAGLARVSFAGGVGFGSLIILYLSIRGNSRALAVLPAWITLAGWTLFTGSAIEGMISHPLLSPGIASGLILVLLLIAFAVTQFALGARMSGANTGRKALALAGAGHSVWDYNLEQKTFFVSPEIEKILGLRPGHFQLGGTHTWLDLMHKEDRANYTDKLEATVKDGMGRLNLSFRMRGTDGKYRWLQLRARAMPGESKRANRCIGILADITHAKLAEERLLRDAVHDYLTGLPNQALFSDRLERALNRYSKEDEYEIGLILIDIDRFNNINDSLGHAAGDSFLLISARRIQEHLSISDTVARISENRFAVLIASQTDGDEIHKIAQKIQKSISEPIPFEPENIYLTTNIGMATFNSEKDDVTEFMKKAEIAMYSAKRHGRNNLSVFDPRMARRTTNRVALESDLRRAIEKSEFKLMYQPIVRLETGKIAGFEALVRWQHKTRGLLGPDEFMDIAEETDLIVDIGRFVLNEAGMQLGSWQRLFTFTEPLFMSVNVSTRQIIQPDLIDDLRSILDRAEIKPGTLKIEVTETQVMENPELASRVLKRIRKIGAGLSLDDFGTGYSSLSYLQSFPFDTIKIDKTFVHSENGNPISDVILKSVVSLAHDLGMSVVAEGAEEVEEAALLNEIGCEFVQGFLFGEPMSARDVQKLLSQKPLLTEESTTESIFSKLTKFKSIVKKPEKPGKTSVLTEDEKATPPQEVEPDPVEVALKEVVAEEKTSQDASLDAASDKTEEADKVEPVEQQIPEADVASVDDDEQEKPDQSLELEQAKTDVSADQQAEPAEPPVKVEAKKPEPEPEEQPLPKKSEKVTQEKPEKSVEIQEQRPDKASAREEVKDGSKQKTEKPPRHQHQSVKSKKTSEDIKAKKVDPRRKPTRKKKRPQRKSGKKKY